MHDLLASMPLIQLRALQAVSEVCRKFFPVRQPNTGCGSEILKAFTLKWHLRLPASLLQLFSFLQISELPFLDRHLWHAPSQMLRQLLAAQGYIFRICDLCLADSGG